MANRLRAWGPSAAWAAVLYLLSASSDLPGPGLVPYGDKIAHFALYAILGILLGYGRSREAKAVSHALLLTLGALYGVTDEWHQMYVPGRVPDVADWLADIVGLSTGYAMAVTRWKRPDPLDEAKGSA